MGQGIEGSYPEAGRLVGGWRPPSPRLLAAVMLSPGAAVFAAVFTLTQKIEAVSGQCCEWSRQQSHFSRHCPVWALGVKVTDFVDTFWGEKTKQNIYLEWFLKPLEIFGKCEQLIPHIFSLINCFFKKRLCWRERVVSIFPLPLAPFPEHWFFNTKRQNFFHCPWNAACILKIQQLSLLFACGFVSFHTLLKPPLCSEHTVPSCEERGVEGRDLREHCLFSQQT